MRNTYLIEIKGKRVKEFLLKLIKKKINIYDIKYYPKKIILLIDYPSYNEIKKIKTTYEINILKISGKKQIYLLLKKYKTYFIFLICSILLLIFLSNIIFFIDINVEDNNLKKLITKEITKNNLTLYSLKKDYQTLKKISTKIKEENKNSIEWIEIKNNGVHLEISAIPRIISTKDKIEDIPKDIIAKKNGLILDMDIDKGSIIKNNGDYVQKGDIIVSGYITRNDNIVGTTSSKGKVYAEVWYKLLISKNFNYEQEINTKTSTLKYQINILGKDLTLLKITKKNTKPTTKNIKFAFFTLKKENIPNKTTITKKYTKQQLLSSLEKTAKKSLEKTLQPDSYIISQKTLKINTNSVKMDIEVFFKVYEDIALIKDSTIPLQE